MHIPRTIACGIAVAAIVGGVTAGTAQAETRSTVYFSHRGVNCAITAVGCDFARPVRMSWWALPGLITVPMPFPVQEAVYEFVVDHAGASCVMHYRSFECRAEGHRFWGDADVDMTTIGT